MVDGWWLLVVGCRNWRDKIMKSFEDLECYKSGRKFRIEVSKFCKTLPKYEEL